MIKGAMDELRVGDPQSLATDVGPVIDAEAQDGIEAYTDANAARILHRVWAPKQGHFIAPVLLKVGGIKDMDREVFGPVLHVATFRADQLDRVIADINARGYGLTFGLHTRIDSRVQEVTEAIHAGNIYVNRNQIGAVVGSQPFGGEGLSGTGPKAGGPLYLARFFAPEPVMPGTEWAKHADSRLLNRKGAPAKEVPVSEQIMPGPTGELNRLSILPRSSVLCLGPGAETVREQVAAVEALGGLALAVDGYLTPEALAAIDGISAAIWWGDQDAGRAYMRALASRKGPIVPLITARPDLAHVAHERHLCVDTTAAGGNAALLAG
jgi:RHH-type proline utilization regulon transcriptional repressor/proline dehydrogenase/delta 1-pyrroline-5-carboxylate dehydrogenase